MKWKKIPPNSQMEEFNATYQIATQFSEYHNSLFFQLLTQTSPLGYGNTLILFASRKHFGSGALWLLQTIYQQNHFLQYKQDFTAGSFCPDADNTFIHHSTA